MGDVVGYTGTGLSYPYDQEPYVDIAGVGLVDLNQLLDENSDWILWRALAVNNTGQIAGVGARDSDGDGAMDTWVLFRLTLDDGTGVPLFEELELPSWADFNGDFMGMNNDGDVISTARRLVGGSYEPASLLWSEDANGDGLLDYAVPGDNVLFTFGGDLTDRRPDGTVQVAAMSTPGGAAGTWRWSGDLQGNGILENLGDINGSYRVSLDINDFGDVTGGAVFSSAFRYTDEGGMEDLGYLLASPRRKDRIDTFGWGINNFKDVVGWSGIGGYSQAIFLYRDGLGMVDLSTQIANLPAGLTTGVDEASYARLYLNNAGQIAGNTSQAGAFILTPVAP